MQKDVSCVRYALYVIAVMLSCYGIAFEFRHESKSSYIFCKLFTWKQLLILLIESKQNGKLFMCTI